ncbi:hypothetical protein BH10BDE1_BH10BDE1_19180 [soil metagenome]
MKSNARLSMQVGAVVAIAITASVWLLSARSVHAVAPSVASDVTSAANPEIEPAPPTVQSAPVALRAQARVNRLQPSGIKPISLKTPEPIRAAAEESVSRLKKIRACEKNPSEACPIHTAITNASASGYSDQLVDETIAELAFLKALAQSEVSEKRVPTFSVGEVAGAYIKHRDDNVREQALGLAELLVKTEPAKVVDIASRALKSTISGPLAAQALELLEASREANPVLVDKTLLSALRSGGWDVRDAVADRLLPFLTPGNRDSFSRILADAPPRSQLRLRMRLNIEEFDRMDRL